MQETAKDKEKKKNCRVTRKFEGSATAETVVARLIRAHAEQK